MKMITTPSFDLDYYPYLDFDRDECEMVKFTRTFVGDFETTVYEGQESTEVWASAMVEIGTENVQIFHSIEETFDFLTSINENIIVYYHNLKFDGSFWLNYLLGEMQYKQAYDGTIENRDIKFPMPAKMKNNTVCYSISDMGSWYRIDVKTKGKIIEFRDSLKLLPFSLARIGKSFKTKHQKLDMEYKGYRYAGCEITPEEAEYIKNDVLVIKEALEIMFNEGHNKLTIGSCCLAEFKKTMRGDYDNYFPDLFHIPIDENRFGSPTVGEYVRKSYRGGWCYVVPEKSRKILHNGFTADVNSLYPSMMSSESGNYYPYGKPSFWWGNYIPDYIFEGQPKYFFIRIRTRFYVKKGYLPFISIKGDPRYISNISLKTSDYYDKKTGKYYAKMKNENGDIVPITVTLTLTQTDYNLMLEHYDLKDFEILDGCWFYAEKGLFDEYMEKYKKIKMESKGAVRELAKLFLNNLYGKMASSPCSSFKVAQIKEDGSLGFITIDEYDKTPGYIPVGSAITSYARNFTIRAAQKNYHGSAPGFVYADTDSIHCDMQPEKVKGIKTHPTNFCCWKLESYWDTGIFIRAKTYIEHITHEDGEKIDDEYYNVKCAGMPERCKELFIRSVTQDYNESEYNKEELDFLKVKRELTDFDFGLTVPSKLLPKQIKGGVVLQDTTFEMKPNLFGN